MACSCFLFLTYAAQQTQMSAFQMPFCHADCLHVPLKEFFRGTKLGQKKVVRDHNGEIDLPRIGTAVCNLLLVSLGNLSSSPGLR